MVLEELLMDVGLSQTFAVGVAKAIRFVVAFIVLTILVRTVVLPLIERLFDNRDLEPYVRRPLLKITWFVLLFGIVTVAVGFAGYGSFLTSLATIGAAATLALGFATQSLLSNFVAGVFLFIERPFRIGDWIEWDDGTYTGIVEDISLRVTRVRTFDNELLTVPNSDLADGVVKNPVAKDTLRQKFAFGIDYDDDIERASEIIVEEAERHDEILDNPAPQVVLTGLGDSDVQLQSRFWIGDPSRAEFMRVRGEYVTAVKQHFDEAGIDIPFPYRTLEGGISIADIDGLESGQFGEPAE